MGKIPYTTSEQEVKRRVAKSMINAKVSRGGIVKAVRVGGRTVRGLRTRRAKRKKGSGRGGESQCRSKDRDKGLNICGSPPSPLGSC